MRQQGSVRWRAVVATLAFSLVAAGASAADTVLMSGNWGERACSAWNEDPVLTQELAQSGWVANDAGRGYKIIRLYRRDCSDSPSVELRIGLENGMARCVYGGAVQSDQLERKSDYLMYADTERWQQMGSGDYGPMKAMMLGRLKFQGPRWEAMKNMGPFANFLLIVGKVGGDTAACPG